MAAWVGIQSEQPAIGVGGLQDPEGVPSAADGRIYLEAARSGCRDAMTSSTITGKCPSSISTAVGVGPSDALEAHLVR